MAGSGWGSGWTGMGTGWAITSTLVAGILFLWGLGYLVDRLVGSDRVFQAVGIIAGGGAGIYVVYLRYGKGDRGQG